MLTRKEVDAKTGKVTTIPLSDEEVIALRAPNPEREWKSLRTRRDALLRATDHYALVDVTLTPEMQAYRQALRDLPANTVDPVEPVWPTKPV